MESERQPAPVASSDLPAGDAPAPRNQRRPPYRVILAVALGIFTLALGYSTIHRAAWSRTHRSDFTVYTAAAQAYVNGEDIYSARNPRGWLYMYLPVFAVGIVPLTWVSAAWAAGIWYALSVLLLAHAIWMAVDLARRYVPGTKWSRFDLSMLVLAAVAWPATSGMARGQASVLVAWLVTLAVWAMLSNRRWLSGAALAGAIVLKVFPLLFVPYLIVSRRWVVAAATATWLILLVFVFPGLAFGHQENLALLKRWVTTVATPANAPDASETSARYAQMADPRIERNQSIRAVLIRIIAPDDAVADATGRERVASALAAGIGLLLLLVTAAAYLLNPGERDNAWAMLVHCCVIIVLMTLISPVAWVHGHVLLALPIAGIAALATDPTDKQRKAMFIKVYAIFIGCTLIAVTIEPLHVWGALMWGTLSLWAAGVWLLVHSRLRWRNRIAAAA